MTRPGAALRSLLAAAAAVALPACAGRYGPAAAGDCRETLPPPPPTTPFSLRFDQVGYEPGSKLWAVLIGSGQPAPGYRIYHDASGCRVGSGTAGPRVLATTSLAGTPLTADTVDLSMIPGPGEYRVILDDGASFGPIRVGPLPLAEILPKLVRFLRVQRCGPTTAELSKHAACHLTASLHDDDPATLSGDAVAVDDDHTGPVSASSGPPVDVEGGWHDAGDHIKFVGTTAFTLVTYLMAIRDHGAALERAAGRPALDELRAEMRWGLDWLVKMLGGAELYHQVSGENDHSGDFRTPETDTRKPAPGYTHRPVYRMSIGRGANLLGRAAAALSLGGQIFAEESAYSARLIALARRLYAEGRRRPMPQNPNPPHFYQERTCDDDMALAAATLARATGESGFRIQAFERVRRMPLDRLPRALSWGNVDSLALLETARAFPERSREREEVTGRLAALAAPTVTTTSAPRGHASAFRYALPELRIDSLADALGAAVTCLAARQLGGHEPCLEVARSQLHWLWGQNPFGLSFQIGVGRAFPRHPHHSFAATAGLVLEGAVLGGPAGIRHFRNQKEIRLPGAGTDHGRWSTDEVAYDDQVHNWVVNEPALDFTAAFVYLLGELAETTLVLTGNR